MRQGMACGRNPGKQWGLIMKKKTVITGVVVIFIVSLIMSYFILRPSEKRIVEIVQEDVVLETIDLDRAQNREFIVRYKDSSNTVRIEDGEIWVEAAECPDHTCMKMGKLYSESLPIVCLPNRLIIRFAE